MHDKDQQIAELKQQLIDAQSSATRGRQLAPSEALVDSYQEVINGVALQNGQPTTHQQDEIAERENGYKAEVARLTRKLAEVETALEWSAAAFYKLSQKLGELQTVEARAASRGDWGFFEFKLGRS